MSSRSPLQPDPVELGLAWKAQVEAEYEQVERLREWHQVDHYTPIAHHFADDPYRTDDDMLDALRALSGPDATWLDIGAGGGRFALPLALSSKQIYAVDPSEGMLNVLREEIQKYNITNVETHHLRWPEGSDRIEADYSLASHVGYDIRDINAFLDGTERATRKLCVSLMMDRAPSGGFVRLWEKVHGEYRYQLPSAREFLHLLLARGAMPEVRLSRRRVRSLDKSEILDNARRRLWLTEGSEKDQFLQRLLSEQADEFDDYQLPTAVVMITWQPAR